MTNGTNRVADRPASGTRPADAAMAAGPVGSPSERCRQVFTGTFFHAPQPGKIEVLDGAMIAVDAAGTITEILPRGHTDFDQLRRAATDAGALTAFRPGTFVLPGFVDLHVHAPQHPQLGTALHVPLETWLHEHTFPLEARFRDLAYARRAYAALVDDLLANGTTTALMFATLHQDATRALVDLCLQKGLRGLVGKVAMDHAAQCPDYYCDGSVDAALDGTRALIDFVRAHPENAGGLVQPVVTPRFIPACSDAALAGLGALARAYGCHVQTHVSESDWEHDHVLRRCGRTDTEALDSFGLLTRRSVLAHGVFLSDHDLERIKARGSGIAHCALSNAYFAGAVFPLKRALDKSVRIGLGTDISAGPSASMFDATRMAVATSRLLASGMDAGRPPRERGCPGAEIDWRTGFHLVTAGGADALDLAIGWFGPGRAFDAILVDACEPKGSIRLSGDEDMETILQKIVYTAPRANIGEVWVAGRRVI